MMGHTDKATINQRRPLTPGMAHLLRRLATVTRLLQVSLDSIEKNQMRALMDRGYATWDIGTRSHSITDAGREAIR